MLITTAENKLLKDRSGCLAQIYKLPLKKMIRYCKDMARKRKKVECLL